MTVTIDNKEFNVTEDGRLVYGPAVAHRQQHRPILEFTAGRLLCRHIRNYLEARRFEGADIEWHEGSGFLSRPWLIRGSVRDMARVARDLKAWMDELDAKK